ncbi:hypothetical protein Efla_006818 [Eimeria flavescens]
MKVFALLTWGPKQRQCRKAAILARPQRRILNRRTALLDDFVSETSLAPRHFAQLRVICIALDVFSPLVVAGDRLDSAVKMEDSKSNKDASGGAGADQQHEGSSEHANPSSAESGGSAEQAAALSDLKAHGTQMTVQERKQAAEILRQKYGAIDREERK